MVVAAKLSGDLCRPRGGRIFNRAVARHGFDHVLHSCRYGDAWWRRIAAVTICPAFAWSRPAPRWSHRSWLGLIRNAFPGAQISIAYGSTEAGSVCTLGPDDIDRKPGSVGLPVPGVAIEEGANGEMLVSSPMVFGSYFRNEAATSRAFERGFFRTGDLAQIDEEGIAR